MTTWCSCRVGVISFVCLKIRRFTTYYVAMIAIARCSAGSLLRSGTIYSLPTKNRIFSQAHWRKFPSQHTSSSLSVLTPPPASNPPVPTPYNVSQLTTCRSRNVRAFYEREAAFLVAPPLAPPPPPPPLPPLSSPLKTLSRARALLGRPLQRLPALRFPASATSHTRPHRT